MSAKPTERGAELTAAELAGGGFRLLKKSTIPR
jgi:hypothetical protein